MTKEGAAAVTEDVRRVRVAEDEVAAAQLQIQLLKRLGRPVDERLETIANAKPAQADAVAAEPEPGRPQRISAAARALQESFAAAVDKALDSRDRTAPLSSVRRHVRERGGSAHRGLYVLRGARDTALVVVLDGVERSINLKLTGPELLTSMRAIDGAVEFDDYDLGDRNDLRL